MTVDQFSVPVGTRAPTGATNAYVVGVDDALLVDPAARTDTLDTVVRARQPATIAVTHTHPDHVGAVAAYAEETGAEVLAADPERLAEAGGVEADGRLREGQAIETGVGPVEVLTTPGHARDHVAFQLPEEDDSGEGTENAGGEGTASDGGGGDGGDQTGPVLCGDLAVAEGSVVVGAPEGDLRAYLTSLRRLHARNPRRLYPGHGPVVEDARATLSRLLEHRLARERKVRLAVAAGATDVESVLEAAYEKDLSGVRDLARATVRAHLEKLDVEGDLAFDPERGTVRPA